MKGKLLAFAVFSALSAGAMAQSYTQQQNPNVIGPNTKVPDNAGIVSAPLMAPDQPAVAPSASAGASTYGTPGTAAPANPPIATTTAPAAPAVANAPVVDSRGNVVGAATVVQPNPVWVTRGVGQSGPGAVDKTRPGYPDDNTSHSAWDVGTSSAGS